jgi:hypothetical protein
MRALSVPVPSPLGRRPDCRRLGDGFADAPPSDVTIVCGGPGWRAQVQDAAMLAFLRSLDPLRVAYAPAL